MLEIMVRAEYKKIYQCFRQVCWKYIKTLVALASYGHKKEKVLNIRIVRVGDGKDGHEESLLMSIREALKVILADIDFGNIRHGY